MAGGKRVIVGVSGSPASLAALRRAVAEARRAEALLVPVLAWSPPGGETAYRRHPVPHLLWEWQQAARKRLDTAFDEAFGGYPSDLRIHPMPVQFAAGPALVQLADDPDDLLVVGTGRRGRLRRLLHTSVSRYCLARAKCPVIAVPPPELLHELSFTARAFRKFPDLETSGWAAAVHAHRG
ncbi:universal stress protein [Streptantibioticus ferralitis]|uniref:Universal stress protein n=1 Tax=Streptantibioticus ferralitis TaxID=236510 RepID=A0ABT5YYH3_9ACTN|nr:universal stress protein [Streptantibioticus ferralitis]MDF2256642.1 universal stress protein [Streptantibioticus ferralitis]